MAHARFSVVYDGPALAGHAMDVRNLAPALLALGELFDAANLALNGDATTVRVTVVAHQPGCFSIDLDVAQTILKQGLALLKGDDIAAALTLKELLVGGVGAAFSVFKLIRWLRGRTPDRLERLPGDMIRVVIGKDVIDVPLRLLRLYQDIAVRTAVEKIVAPLESEGIETVSFRQGDAETTIVREEELPLYRAPEIEDKVLIDDRRRAAFSIVSLAFKEDNKWRLHDGQNQISATIADEDFLRRVDQNLISFSKGDVLVCEVRFLQKQTAKGLATEHIVEKVIEHRPAPRQIDWLIEEPKNPEG